MSESRREATRMSGNGREAIPDVCESLPYIRDWSVVSSVCLGVVERPSRICGSGLEALPDV